MGGDRLGIDTRKKRIELLTDGDMLNAMLSENAGKNTATGAVHGIYSEVEIRFFNGGEIGELDDGSDVRGLEIDFFNSCFLPLGSRLIELRLDAFHDGWRGRSAECAFEFDTVPVPGIVARRDHDPASGSGLFDGERNGRSGRVIVGKTHGNARGGENLSGDACAILRGKASVIADNDAVLRVLVLKNVRGDRAGDAAHVVEGEVVGDNAAPSVGAEFDGHNKLLITGCQPNCFFGPGSALRADAFLRKRLQLLFVQMLDDFADVLCLLEGRDQQSVGGFDDD
jgi:hypothetical protein